MTPKPSLELQVDVLRANLQDARNAIAQYKDMFEKMNNKELAYSATEMLIQIDRVLDPARFNPGGRNTDEESST